MSDRTRGSVRTGTRSDTSATTTGTETPAETTVSTTQAIPTGQNRVVQSGRASAPTATGERPAAPATGGAPPAPAVVPGAAASATGGATTVRKGKGGGRGPRRARLQLRHIDTWSAFKISFVLSVALFFMWLVAVGVLYGVLGGLGVFDTLNELFGQLGSSKGGDVITPGVVFGAAAVIGAVNIILLTALGTVCAFIYNLCSDLVGGLEVTLSERD
jgi:hypothetical protein